MSERRLKIAYLCDMDPSLPWAYSGGNSRIFQAVQDHVGDVQFIDNGWGRWDALRLAIHKTPVAINLRLRWRAHYALGRLIARGVNQQLAEGGFDAALGVYSLQSLAHVAPPAHVPLVFTSDATQTSYRQSEVGSEFGSFYKPGRLLDGWVMRQERAVLSRTDANIWPSEWQLTQAQTTYGLQTDQQILLPWGANIQAPDRADLQLDLGFSAGLRLLLVGRDWQAKGGDVAFDTVQALRARGVDAALTVIGCTPPAHAQRPFVTVHADLDKSNPNDLTVFEEAYRQAHVLMQPSLESYGFAFCEASAFGVPSLCWRQGGIPVWDGVNGQALPVGQGAEAFADQIEAWMKTPERYRALRQSSRACFEERLNWAAWGRGMKRHLTQLIAQKRAEL